MASPVGGSSWLLRPPPRLSGVADSTRGDRSGPTGSMNWSRASRPGSFTLSRSGATSADSTVYCGASGSATPGSDYAALAGSAVIPAGPATASVSVTESTWVIYGVQYPPPRVDSDGVVLDRLGARAGLADVGAPSCEECPTSDLDRNHRLVAGRPGGRQGGPWSCHREAGQAAPAQDDTPPGRKDHRRTRPVRRDRTQAGLCH